MELPRIDLSKGSVPILIVVSLLTAVGIGGIYLGKAMGQLDQLTTSVNILTESMKEVQTALAKGVLVDNWKTSDQVAFCLRAERNNPGWKCPAVE